MPPSETNIEDSSNGLYYAALVVIGALAVFSLVSYRQRMYFIDPAWVVFNIINKGTLIISEHRYGAFITQLFPYIGSRLGLPLRVVMMLYSVSFYLFYFSVAWLLGKVFGQKWLAVLLGIYLTLLVGDVYYWPNNEVHQGVAWMLLFVGIYLYAEAQHLSMLSWQYWVAVVVAALAVSSHLLVAIPLVFIWVYIHVSLPLKALLGNKKLLFTTLFLAGMVIVRYQMSTSGWYDAGKLEAVHQLTVGRFFAAFANGQSISFAGLLASQYGMAIVVFAGSLFYLLAKRDYFKAFIYVAFSVVYYGLVCLTYPDRFGRELQFYMESEWMPWAVILALPLVYDVRDGAKTWFRGIIVVVFISGCYHIQQSFSHFNQRFQRLEALVHRLQVQNKHKAVLTQSDSLSRADYMMWWGIPAETMLLSAAEGREATATVIILPEIPETPFAADSFYTPFAAIPINSLNQNYFALDSTEMYEMPSH